VRIRVVPSAQRQIREAIDWWRSNRPAAPGAVTDELRRAFRLLRSQPTIGARARNVGLESVRRILLSRIRYHVYYRLSPAGDAIEILALWHSSRGIAPP
jgi:plasmid stabilization system protein ParE